MSVDKSAECRQNAEKDLPNSSLCQNGKQVEIITKMIFELCYIEDNNMKPIYDQLQSNHQAFDTMYHY